MGRLIDVVNRGGSNFAIMEVDDALGLNTKLALAQLGETPRAQGVTEGDILIALGKNRDTFSPFGILMTVQGTILKYTGNVIGSGICLVAMTVGIAWVGEKGYNVYQAVKDAGLGLGAKGKEEDALYDEEQFAQLPIYELVLGFMPTVVSNLLRKVVSAALGAGSSTPPPQIVSAAAPQSRGSQIVGALNLLAQADEHELDEVAEDLGIERETVEMLRDSIAS